jgi:hypothetical protein
VEKTAAMFNREADAAARVICTPKSRMFDQPKSEDVYET